MATLKEIQNCQLSILKDVADFCDKHNINYYLAYGTLLGAVRHKGFIPWDDDVDIFMEYYDLQRFKKLFIKEMSDKYFYQDNETDHTYIHMFSKIRKLGTYMPEDDEYHEHQEVWIDIFPLFSMSNNEENDKLLVKTLCDFQLALAEYGGYSMKGNLSLKGRIIRLYNSIKFKNRIKKCKRIIITLQSNMSEKYTILGNMFWKQFDEEMCSIVFSHMIPKKWLNNKKTYSFEKYKFSSFNNSNEYLIMEYGKDYMVPIKYAHLSDYSKVTV